MLITNGVMCVLPISKETEALRQRIAVGDSVWVQTGCIVITYDHCQMKKKIGVVYVSLWRMTNLISLQRI